MQASPSPSEIKDEVEMKGRISRELYDEFVGYFPQFGSTQWAVQLGIQCIVEVARANPTPLQLRSLLEALVKEVQSNPDNLNST